MGEAPRLTQESIGKCARAEQRSFTVPSLAPPPYNLSAVPRQRNKAQMKEQSKASERELSKEEITNLSDGEFKALVNQNAHRSD